MRKQLENKVMVVLGAGSGIGAATALRARTEGARVILAGINQAGLTALAAKLQSDGTKILVVPTDVRRPESTAKLASLAMELHGRVDVVVNCAGVLCPGRLEKLSEETIRREVDTNFLGTVFVTQAFLPYFRRQGGGHLVHLGSLGGIAPMPGGAIYSATKFAVRGFCLALGMELRETSIKVSIVSPDSVDTPMLEREALANGSSFSFSGSLLKPDEVASAIVRTILHPTPEVLVPRIRGSLTKLVNLSPRLMALLYPMLNRSGERGRKAYLERLKQRARWHGRWQPSHK